MIIDEREMNNQKRRRAPKSRAKNYQWRVLEKGLREHRAPLTERWVRNLMQHMRDTEGKRIGSPRSDRAA